MVCGRAAASALFCSLNVFSVMPPRKHQYYVAPKDWIKEYVSWISALAATCSFLGSDMFCSDSLWHIFGQHRYETGKQALKVSIALPGRHSNRLSSIQDLIKRGRVPGSLYGLGLPVLLLHFPVSTLDIYINRDVIGPNHKFKLVRSLMVEPGEKQDA